MEVSETDSGRMVQIVRWVARIWSVLSLVLVLVFLAGEILSPHAPGSLTLQDIVGLVFFPLGVCLGMILAWRWEGWGGLLTTGSLIAFYMTQGMGDGELPRGPYFLLLAAPGILFLGAWALESRGMR